MSSAGRRSKVSGHAAGGDVVRPSVHFAEVGASVSCGYGKTSSKELDRSAMKKVERSWELEKEGLQAGRSEGGSRVGTRGADGPRLCLVLTTQSRLLSRPLRDFWEAMVGSGISGGFNGTSDASSIIKLGEGTYGEAFRAGETVCKVVPIDGDLVVNGEIQKKSEEVLEEVLLSLTLNSLREQHKNSEKLNSCGSFIETKDFRVCQGLYDTNLIRAWEDWDAKNNSENDHPCAFPEDQRYIVFVLADGGKDLENFVLLNFNEARSLLVQVTAALAVAEVACEFEHRDLHWGNILLRREGATMADFTLEGKKKSVSTFGLTVSIIDFTLSRINTGEAVLFLNLSSDPELFKGPKWNIQFETYRRMKEVTGECWEESFPKTNVLWLMYLVDILDKKKIYERTIKDERNLRSFKRRLHNFESAKDTLSDPFLSELFDD